MAVGQRVGVGWYGGHCGHCDRCRRGDFVTCREARVPGISYDGGYAEYMVAPVQALALIPDELSAVEAGPLLCAGITTYNALRNSGARAGDARRHPWHRRPRSPRGAVRRPDGLSHGRHRPRRATRRRWHASSAPTTTSTAGPRTWPSG